MPRNIVKNITSSVVVIAGEGVLEGMYINSTSSGVIDIYHGQTAANNGVPFFGRITPAIGYHYLGNLVATAGIYVGTPIGTINATFYIRTSDV